MYKLVVVAAESLTDSHMIQKVIKDYQVYVDLFTSFWAGGANEHIDQSNAAVFVNAFAECVVYMAATVRYAFSPL